MRKCFGDLRPVFVKEAQGEEEADGLADDRGQGCAPGPHLHRAHEEDIQDHVDHRGDGDEHEGMLRIAHAAQDRADQVIAVDEHHAVDAGNAVLPGVFPDLVRRVEPGDDSLVGEQEDDHDDHGQAFQQGKKRTDHLAHQVRAPCADVAGDQDLAGVGKAHGHESDQHQHLAADSYGGQAFRADEVADDDHVHHVVDQLQQAGEEKRQRKRDQRTRYAARRQIPDNRLALLHQSTLHPFYSNIESGSYQ